MKKALLILLALITALMCACGKTAAKPLDEVYKDLKAEIVSENVNELSDIKLMQRYYGITSDMAVEFAGCINASGVDQEEIVLVKAADDSAAGSIKDKLETRYQTKLSQNKNYNAEQAAMISACSVERDGLYVSMIVSKNAERIREIYRADIGLK
ncbi:MAG: DUF4358 domain-containing protein [Ruminococcus sp.]|nr:DUF4358 domain-containing protein [Ruminococcus sp.]